MNEYNTLFQWGVSMLGLTISSFLYAWGGISGKWRRRFVGSFILACTINGVCAWRGVWSPYFLIVYPLTIGAWVLPYGSDRFFTKVLLRTSFALAACMSGLIFCIIMGGNAWWLLIPHVGVALWSVYLGVKNPIESTAEQGVICVLLSIILICYPFCVGF